MSYETARTIRCPVCRERDIETVSTAPYVRGFVVAISFGTKGFIGCVPCVRGQLLQEAGLSALIGWWSITALFVNPFMIVINLGKAAFLQPDAKKVADALQRAGISATAPDLAKVASALAAKMVLADGRVEASEMTTAEEIGKRIVPDFSVDDFRALVRDHKQLPDAMHLANLLSQAVAPEGCEVVCRYLLAIAAADGSIDDKEAALLTQIMMKLGVDMKQLQAKTG